MGLTIFLIIIGYCIIGIICGYLTKSLKEEKGYEGGFFIGFFLGIIGLIYCAGLPDKSTNTCNSINLDSSKDDLTNTYEQTDSETKYCAVCHSIINPDLNYCPSCGTKSYRCAKCGYEVYPEDEKCTNCGAKRPKNN